MVWLGAACVIAVVASFDALVAVVAVVAPSPTRPPGLCPPPPPPPPVRLHAAKGRDPARAEPVRARASGARSSGGPGAHRVRGDMEGGRGGGGGRHWATGISVRPWQWRRLGAALSSHPPCVSLAGPSARTPIAVLSFS